MADDAQTPPKDLNGRQKLLIGGLGALVPTVINLITVDLVSTLAGLTLLVLVAYAIRVVALFFLGGLAAYFHKDERSPVKLLQLGIVAPALITAVINGHNQVAAEGLKNSAAGGGRPAAVFSLLPSVYAETGDPQEAKVLLPPIETFSEQIWRGLTGAKSSRVYYVRAGKHDTQKAAESQAEQISQGGKFKAEVYLVDQDDPDHQRYEVIIGVNLTYEDARRLKREADKSGISSDLDVKKGPQ